LLNTRDRGTDSEGRSADVPAGHDRRHRSDIDGLRAVAVLLVVLFHARAAGFEAGFVGVDVFFVISGFLITRLIVDEIEETGQLSLTRFWARRIRRLAPALALVSIAVAVASFFINSPLRWGQVASDAAASSLYISNVVFASRAAGYFEQSVPSPLLHTWSLAVEEQFYLLWPLAILSIFFVTSRASGKLRGILKWLVPLACVASFGISVLLSYRGTPWAYYSLPTRWWQIGIGATLGVWLTGERSRHLSRHLSMWLGITGACGLVASLILIRPTTPYPGFAALGPSVSTAALLAASNGGFVQRVLSTRALQWLGERSYSWYLWHWPVLAFAATLAVDGSIASRVAVAIVSLVPAMLSYSFVEHPVRFGPRFTVGLRPSYLVGAVCVTCGLLAAGLLAAAERAQLRDPYFRVLRDAVSARSADYKLESCTGVDPHDCGGAGGPMVMLIGDSHAAHWLPAVSAAVEKLGGRLAVRAYGSCPPWRVQVAVVRTGRPSEACRAFSQETDKIIERTRPSMVIVASGNYSGRLLDPSTGELFVESDEAAVWTTAVEEYLRWLAPRTRGVGLILDNPYVPFDPIECLARTRSPSNCEFSPASVSRKLPPAAGHGRRPGGRLRPETLLGQAEAAVHLQWR
jgi:peptidoglycan/LPS O-acetylase OafA/YrhL